MRLTCSGYCGNDCPGHSLLPGAPPTVNPAMFSEQFDVVFCGEGDLTFPRFCPDYLKTCSTPGDLAPLDLASYPELYRNRGGSFMVTPPGHHSSEILNRLPLLDRSGFDHPRYQAVIKQNAGLKQATLLVTRGCPFSCDFCSKPVWGDLFRKPRWRRCF